LHGGGEDEKLFYKGDGVTRKKENALSERDVGGLITIRWKGTFHCIGDGRAQMSSRFQSNGNCSFLTGTAGQIAKNIKRPDESAGGG